MPQQETFFLGEFDPETDAHQHQSQPTAQCTGFNRRAETHCQQSRVDGMSDETIGAAAYQLVILLEGNIAAPVSGERPPRPEGYKQSKEAKEDADCQDAVRMWHQRPVHRRWPMMIGQEPCAQPHRDAMGQGGGQTLLLRDHFPLQRADQPIDDKNNPTGSDNRAGDSFHSEWKTGIP